MSSWLREEMTKRTYRLTEKGVQMVNALLWEVQNEYQKVTACKEPPLFCRLTHISMGAKVGELQITNWHNNYHHDLSVLKTVAVHDVDVHPVSEVLAGSGWTLQCQGELFGVNIVNAK
jgi:hypothetical protein